MEEVWKGLGENQEEILYIDKFGGYKAEVLQRVEVKEKPAPRKKANEEENLEDLRRVNRKDRNARPPPPRSMRS